MWGEAQQSAKYDLKQTVLLIIAYLKTYIHLFKDLVVFKQVILVN